MGEAEPTSTADTRPCRRAPISRTEWVPSSRGVGGKFRCHTRSVPPSLSRRYQTKGPSLVTQTALTRVSLSHQFQPPTDDQFQCRLLRLFHGGNRGSSRVRRSRARQRGGSAEAAKLPSDPLRGESHAVRRTIPLGTPFKAKDLPCAGLLL